MAVVTSGLGLPEEGALVAFGLGVSELDLNAMTAHLAGVGSLTADLTDGGTPVPPVSGGAPWASLVRPIFIPKVKVGRLSAHLSGSSTLTATGHTVDVWQPVDDFNFNIELLLELV